MRITDHQAKMKLREIPQRILAALKNPWVRRGILALLIAPPLVPVALAVVTPLPAELRENHANDSSIRVLDRHGRLLAEVRANDGTRSKWIKLDELGPYLPQAILQAEDARFYRHPGVDPFSILRAMGQNLWRRRIVSGASTLTQQVARTLVARPRTMTGKIKEMSVAFRVEASLSKSEIFEQYINQISFGPSLRGVEAASRFYFDKPAAMLSLAESASIAAMPRGPALYDPRQNPQRLELRRNHILDKMNASGLVTPVQADSAKREPITLQQRATGWSAPHLIRGLLSGEIHPEIGPLQDKVSTIQTTLDADLQRESQTAARVLVQSLSSRNASTAAVVVLDNATGEVLAWVGAHDFLDEKHFGQNDGVLARRQPGSTLKPFVYSSAIDELQWSPSTVLPDIPLHLQTEKGVYSPENYDGHFHGPVRLREALANSYNIPAVYTASQVGPARILDRLRAVGLRTLNQDANYYGAAIALGDGEVRLIDLASAYATLARSGNYLPHRTILSVQTTKDSTVNLPIAVPQSVISPTTCELILDILRDDNARIAAFGEESAIDLPFDVAVKTGTSKGFRDNLTVGSTKRLTVAVWVGNFDGSPMQGVSGVTGAGPLFRQVMTAAARHDSREELHAQHASVLQIEVCPLSGQLPGPACPHKIREIFAQSNRPEQPCTIHAKRLVDQRNGLLAGPDCASDHTKTIVVESYGELFAAWAHSANRPLPPVDYSPLCPAGVGITTGEQSALRIRYPYDGAVFLLDPGKSAQSQGIVIRVDAPSSVKNVRFFLNGQLAGSHGAPFEHVLQLQEGHHRLRVEASGMKASGEIEFEVR